MTGLIQISLSGDVTPVTKWNGTYSVDPENCTVTKTAQIVGAVHFCVTAGAGFQELRFMATQRRGSKTVAVSGADLGISV